MEPAFEQQNIAAGEGACRAPCHGLPAEIPVSDFFSSALSKIQKYFILSSSHELYWIGLSKMQSWKKRSKSFFAPKQDSTLFSSPLPKQGDNSGVNTHNTAHMNTVIPGIKLVLGLHVQ